MKDYTSIEKAFPGLNKEYRFAKLEEKGAQRNPFEQFAQWLGDAVKANVSKPNAMIVSTVSAKGMPSSRVLLLKGFDEHGFVFFTHYTSPKAEDLKTTPRASLVFFWPQQERQVRITGKIKKTTRQESVDYFRGRSDDAKLASWISAQSRTIKDRGALEEKLEATRRKFKGKEIPCPEFWGGYRLFPTDFEFWQGREYRLNDRLLYRKTLRGWKIQRLQP
ncbi:MAG: pyridoxamine 5'-phosphate oxidase [Candidatus Omnitrophica bacterium]|nr:pyridoxamine 5'-phosphate oxidase [Candidatus Omnitrophota bacterium]